MALTIESTLRRDDKSHFLKFSGILLNFVWKTAPDWSAEINAGK